MCLAPTSAQCKVADADRGQSAEGNEPPLRGDDTDTRGLVLFSFGGTFAAFCDSFSGAPSVFNAFLVSASCSRHVFVAQMFWIAGSVNILPAHDQAPVISVIGSASEPEYLFGILRKFPPSDAAVPLNGFSSSLSSIEPLVMGEIGRRPETRVVSKATQIRFEQF
jgi:hypothetical protein